MDVCVVTFVALSLVLLWRLKSGTLRVLISICLLCLLVLGLVGRAALNKKRRATSPPRSTTPAPEPSPANPDLLRVISWNLNGDFDDIPDPRPVANPEQLRADPAPLRRTTC